MRRLTVPDLESSSIAELAERVAGDATAAGATGTDEAAAEDDEDDDVELEIFRQATLPPIPSPPQRDLAAALGVSAATAAAEAPVAPTLAAGTACITGYVPEGAKVNQDSLAVLLAPHFTGHPGQHFVGVFDGHGVAGEKVSTFLRRALPSLCVSAVTQARGGGADSDAATAATASTAADFTAAMHVSVGTAAAEPPHDAAGGAGAGGGTDGSGDEPCIEALECDADESGVAAALVRAHAEAALQLQRWCGGDATAGAFGVHGGAGGAESAGVDAEAGDLDAAADGGGADTPPPNLRTAGTTSVMLLLVGNQAWCANVGDSRCVLATRDGGGSGLVAVPLSFDHKPETPAERRRIEAAGGCVRQARHPFTGELFGCQRVWAGEDAMRPGLAMARSFGDKTAAAVGVVNVPDVVRRELTPSDAFLVLGSDGLFEFMSSAEVIAFAAPLLHAGQSADDVAEALGREASRRWEAEEESVDDITAVVVTLQWGA